MFSVSWDTHCKPSRSNSFILIFLEAIYDSRIYFVPSFSHVPNFGHGPA